MSPFSPEQCKLESSNIAYICRMSDCIVELRLTIMDFIFLFLSFPTVYNMLTLKILCWSFLKNF